MAASIATKSSVFAVEIVLVLHRGCTPALKRQRRYPRKTQATDCCGIGVGFGAGAVVCFVVGGVGRCACAPSDADDDDLAAEPLH